MIKDVKLRLQLEGFDEANATLSQLKRIAEDISKSTEEKIQKEKASSAELRKIRAEEMVQTEKVQRNENLE